MDPRGQPLRDRRAARDRAARESDRIVRQLDQRARGARTEPGEQRMLRDLLLDDGDLARIGDAVGAHRSDHRFDQEPPRIVGPQPAAEQLLHASVHAEVYMLAAARKASAPTYNSAPSTITAAIAIAAAAAANPSKRRVIGSPPPGR